MIKGDASEILALAADLRGAPAKAGLIVREVIQEGGEDLRDEWQGIAAVTAGDHGVHYPASIESDMVFSLGGATAEVGPNPAKKQGGMSFEFGSDMQPPHLDGLYALDAVEGPLAETLADRVAEVFE